MEEKVNNVCPKCGSDNISPIFYGISGPVSEEIKNGKEPVRLGYMYSPGQPIWHCNDCGHEW